MRESRPIHLAVSTMRLPITAVVSILHRATGVALVAISVYFTWLLQLSLSSAAGFQQAIQTLQQPITKGYVWLFLTVLSYHTLAGIRHLVMDAGIGESLKGGRIGAYLVLLLWLLDSMAIYWWLFYR